MTLDKVVAALKREVVMREKVYPVRVLDGKMTQEEADHEVAAMKEALRIIDALNCGDDPQIVPTNPRLF